MKARVILVIFGLAFCITLAVIIGQRLSSEAMAVMVGVVAGVAASIPTSLIVLWLVMRSPRGRMEAPSPPPETRVMMMVPPSAAYDFAQTAYSTSARAQAPQYPALPMAPEARHFTVIGGADVDLDELGVVEAVPRRR